jgi:acetyl esterase/lipase
VSGGARRATIIVLLVALVLGAANVSARVDVVERRDVTYAPGVQLDAYLPVERAEPVPAVLVIHGGGWRSGDKHGWAQRSRALVRETGWVVVAVNYDLDAAEPWRTQPDDVRAAIEWVRDNAGDLGVDPEHIGLIGSSAGGHLAMLVATTGAHVRAVVSWSGPSDLPRLAGAPRGDRLVKDLAARYIGGSLDAEPERWLDGSPIAHVDPGDPPMLLAGSQDETEVPIDQVTAMRDALEANAVEVVATIVPGRRHASNFADDVWGETVQFLRDHI